MSRRVRDRAKVKRGEGPGGGGTVVAVRSPRAADLSPRDYAGADARADSRDHKLRCRASAARPHGVPRGFPLGRARHASAPLR